jgi:hypothetical protein
MDSRLSIFDPVDMQEAFLEIDGIPTQRHRFSHPQTMSVHEENERCITGGMATDFSGSSNDLINFVRGQVFPRPPFGISWLLGWYLNRK